MDSPAPSLSTQKELIVGYAVSNSRAQLIADEINNHICEQREGQPATNCKIVACLNPHSLIIAKKDKAFNEALSSADWLVPDGVGIVLASIVLGGRIRRRVTGSDIFTSVLDRISKLENPKVFFVGSTRATLELIRGRLQNEYPKIEIAGLISPTFSSEMPESESRRIVEEINLASPDVVWIGMTAPKQEKWLANHRSEINAPIAASIGAVFDFYSGRIRRSPAILCKMGLEWLPRLIQEPRRLWKRVFVSGPIFFGLVAIEWGRKASRNTLRK